MYTIPENTELTADVIKAAIDENETQRFRRNLNELYYLGFHPINDRKKHRRFANHKVVTNHAKYITDIHTGYLFGNPIDYQVSEDIDIEPILDSYKKQNIASLDHELGKGNSIMGSDYELVYNVDNQIKSAESDVRNTVMVYDDTVDHKELFGITYLYQDAKTFGAVTVYTANEVINCCQDGKIVVPAAGDVLFRKDHFFGEVPIIDYMNNVERLGDAEPVHSLIDAYNLIQSDNVNERVQLVESILLIKNATLTPDQKTEMIRERIISGLPEDSDFAYLVKGGDPVSADNLRKVIESDIHKISMTPNMTDENFVGNSSGVAIKYKLLPFEQCAKNKENLFEKGLKKRFRLYNKYFNKLQGMPIIPDYEVDAVFTRSLPQNELELSQIVTNLTGHVSEKTILKLLPFVKDVDEEMKQLQAEKEAAASLGSQQFGTPDISQGAAQTMVDQGVAGKQDGILNRISKLLKGE